MVNLEELNVFPAGETVIAFRSVQTIERLRDAHRDLAERRRRGTEDDDRVMQLVALRGIDEQLCRVHANASLTRCATSSTVPFASITTNRLGSAFAKARYPSRTRR